MTKTTIKSTKAQLKNDIGNILAVGDELAVKYEGYEDAYVTQGNKALNVLLTEIMELAENVYATGNVEEVIKAMRKQLKNINIKTQKNSVDLTIIARYVTRTNRKNALVYARVIGEAFKLKKTSAELAQFIEENGGINKIREKNVNADAVRVKKENDNCFEYFTKQWLEEKNMANDILAEFEIAEYCSAKLHDMTRFGDFTYLICDRVGNKIRVLDVAAGMDKKLEFEILLRNWNFTFETRSRYIGVDATNVENKQKMDATLERVNAYRISKGYEALTMEDIRKD